MLHKNRKLFSALILLPSATLAASPPDSPTPVDNSSRAMYSIDDVCKRLETGAEGVKRAVTEPTCGPKMMTCSVNEMMEKAPSKDNSNGAQPGDVAGGKTYWGLTDGNWGPQTGTAPNHDAKSDTPAATNQTIADGCHKGSIIKGDPKLLPENLREGVTIFGVVGTAKLAPPAPATPKPLPYVY